MSMEIRTVSFFTHVHSSFMGGNSPGSLGTFHLSFFIAHGLFLPLKLAIHLILVSCTRDIPIHLQFQAIFPLHKIVSLHPVLPYPFFFSAIPLSLVSYIVINSSSRDQHSHLSLTPIELHPSRSFLTFPVIHVPSPLILNTECTPFSPKNPVLTFS